MVNFDLATLLNKTNIVRITTSFKGSFGRELISAIESSVQSGKKIEAFENDGRFEYLCLNDDPWSFFGRCDLKSLALSSCLYNITDDNFKTRMKLLDSICNLEKLEFAGNGFEEPKMDPICRLISRNPKIRSINLSGNEFGSTAIAKLFDEIKYSTEIIHVNLDSNWDCVEISLIHNRCEINQNANRISTHYPLISRIPSDLTIHFV